MLTAIFYIFAFSSWGLGLISWLLLLDRFMSGTSFKKESNALDLNQKRALYDQFSQITSRGMAGSVPTPWGNVGKATNSNELIPEKIKELMKSSPNHPEVEEIDGSDQILGIRFEAKNYPPGFSDEENE